MPRSKHRRKPDGKAVAHPGCGASVITISAEPPEAKIPRPRPAQKGTVGLPLFNAAPRPNPG